MIILTDLMMEASRLHARATLDRKPVDTARLAILAGAEILDAHKARELLPDARGVQTVIAKAEESTHPAALLIDTGSAARDAIILVNAEENSTAGRALVALALAHAALEPPACKIAGTQSRMVVLSLPNAGMRTSDSSQADVAFEAGPAVRHDPSGAGISFRPVAEMGIARLALSLLATESEIHTTAEWIGAGTDEGREQRLVDMLALRAGVPADWIAQGVRRHAGGVLKAAPKTARRSAA